MKKQFTRLAALVMCAVMCVSLAACGSKKAATLEEYITSIQDEIDKQIEEAGDDVKLAVIADGNKLVYSYQYTYDVEEMLGVDLATIKDALDPELENMAGDFKDALAEIKKVVSSAEAIVVKYLDMDGNEITSMEFN